MTLSRYHRNYHTRWVFIALISVPRGTGIGYYTLCVGISPHDTRCAIAKRLNLSWFLFWSKWIHPKVRFHICASRLIFSSQILWCVSQVQARHRVHQTFFYGHCWCSISYGRWWRKLFLDRNSWGTWSRRQWTAWQWRSKRLLLLIRRVYVWCSRITIYAFIYFLFQLTVWGEQ